MPQRLKPNSIRLRSARLKPCPSENVCADVRERSESCLDGQSVPREARLRRARSSVPAVLQHVSFGERTDGQTLHGAGHIFAHFK